MSDANIVIKIKSTKLFLYIYTMIYRRTIRKIEDVEVYMKGLSHDILFEVLGPTLAKKVHKRIQETCTPIFKNVLGLDYYQSKEGYKIYVITLYKR